MMVLCSGSFDIKRNNMEETSSDIINLLSDLEEGQLEEISDVSSEEELLLRQRIEILENYNSVLERKYQRENSVNRETSDFCRRREKRLVRNKAKHLKKRRRNASIKTHASKRHKHRRKDSSSESDNEMYKKKILRAVGISDKKVTQTSLKNRLFPIINEAKPENKIYSCNESTINVQSIQEDPTECKENVAESNGVSVKLKNVDKDVSEGHLTPPGCEETVDIEIGQCDQQSKGDEKVETADNDISEDDAELLRQLALNSKSKRKVTEVTPKIIVDNIVCTEKEQENKDGDGSDSDITELRINALRSAMLKKAMERKRQRKESRRKRNSKRFRKSEVFSDLEDKLSYRSNNDNTDVEEIDMDVDPESLQSSSNNIYYDQDIDPPESMVYIDQQLYYPMDDQGYHQYMYNDLQYYDSNNYILQPIKHTDTCNIIDYQTPNQVSDDVDEDEDALRAKLLNSISNSTSNSSKSVKENISIPSTSKIQISKTDDSNLIIRLGESDSESDCEETKQLILTNQRIQREMAFQRNLDMFLKTARSKVENMAVTTPVRPQGVTLASPIVKKHTPVAVKHLPAADQQEYRELVKRMSELQKVKMAKQQQAMINNIANKDDQRSILVTESQSKQTDKAKKIVVDSASKINSALDNNKTKSALDERVAQSNQQVIEKQKRLTKTIELHLELTRKKILNQTKLMKRLEAESRNLKLKSDNLKIQAQEIEIALKSTRAQISDNQRLANNTNKTLSKLQKHEEILRTKIKTISMETNRKLKPNLNQNLDNFTTKIMMKNKVINKKPNVAANKIVPQLTKPHVNISNKLDGFVKPITKVIVNNVEQTRKVVIGNKQDKNPTLVPANKPNIKTEVDSKQVVQKTVVRHIKETVEPLNTAVKKNERNNVDKLSNRKNDTEIFTANVGTIATMKIEASSESDVPKDKEKVLENSCDDKSSSVEENSNVSCKGVVEQNLENLIVNENHTKEKNVIVENVQEECSKIVENSVSNTCDKNDNVERDDKETRNSEVAETTEKQSTQLELNVKESEKVLKSTVDSSEEMTKEPCTVNDKKQINNEENNSVIKHSVIDDTKVLKLKDSSDNDYESPLHVLKAKNTWSEDAQAIFCPFEVGGSCKDPECKYYHPRSS